jgi:hypothetical protein
MGIPDGALVEITVSGVHNANTMANVFQQVLGGTDGSVDAGDLAEAWWNGVKDTYRSVATTVYTQLFQTVTVRELNAPLGALGTYAIPSGEQAGTRSPGSAAGALPPYCAVAIQLAVSTRVTRPGQKRLGGLVESDQNDGYLDGPVYAAAVAWSAEMISTQTLGIPALLATTTPIVCRKDATGVVTAHQPITSALVSPIVSTQNSRKYGHGI